MARRKRSLDERAQDQASAPFIKAGLRARAQLRQQRLDAVVDLRHITHLRASDEEDTLTGTLTLFGVPHHIELYRVHDVDGVQTPTYDPFRRYEDLQRCYEGRYRTVRVPSYDGEWVAHVMPFA